MQPPSTFIRSYGPLVAAVVFCASILNLCVLFYAPKLTADGGNLSASSRKNEFTWVADDFPEFWPVAADEIAMVVDESARYSITGIDAKEEWASNSPAGFGYLRLGPEKRYYALDLAHQLHCLRNIRGGLAGNHSPEMRWHVQHCFNFLRLMVLCMPNLTLEPADVLDRDFEVHRTGATHVCKDWRQYFKEMEENWDSFLGNRSSVYEQ
ncbi:hypothetical protein C8R45DRAFT_911382 [Mycena sanguinolenta]|nr:hypothetical protein C8R45DRAFT_911382 [Mycena sanguinolenta]